MSREVMQQALEALKEAQGWVPNHTGVYLRLGKAIAALEVALSAPEPEPEPFAWGTESRWVTESGTGYCSRRCVSVAKMAGYFPLYRAPVQPSLDALQDAFRSGYAAAEADAARCELPPLGWHCTRKAGHDGPCAAAPNDDAELVAKGMARLREAAPVQPAAPAGELPPLHLPPSDNASGYSTEATVKIATEYAQRAMSRAALAAQPALDGSCWMELGTCRLAASDRPRPGPNWIKIWREAAPGGKE